MIAAPGLDAPIELRIRLADLYCAYSDALDDGELERWPDFFTEGCLYKVIPRENFEQQLPIALIYCESRDMLVDRVVALRETALFVPRSVRHLTSNIRLRAEGPDGFRLTANFALYRQWSIGRPSCFCAAGITTGSSKTAGACALPRGSAFTIRRSSRSHSSTRYMAMLQTDRL